MLINNDYIAYIANCLVSMPLLDACSGDKVLLFCYIIIFLYDNIYFKRLVDIQWNNGICKCETRYGVKKNNFLTKFLSKYPDRILYESRIQF